MITHAHGGRTFKAISVRQVKGLQGWVVAGKTEGDGFCILALEAHGKGFASRSAARAARKELVA